MGGFTRSDLRVRIYAFPAKSTRFAYFVLRILGKISAKRVFPTSPQSFNDINAA